MLEPHARNEARVAGHIRDVEGATVQGHPADASLAEGERPPYGQDATQDRVRRRPHVQGLGSNIGDPEVDHGGIHQGGGSLRDFAKHLFDVQ